MRIRRTGRAAIGTAAASAAMLLGAMSGTASAAPESTAAANCGDSGTLCLWEGAFTGQTVVYANPGTDCVTLPFGVLADLNNTDKSITYYKSTDCSGSAALVMPPLDLHSWTSYGAMYSFRAS